MQAAFPYRGVIMCFLCLRCVHFSWPIDAYMFAGTPCCHTTPTGHNKLIDLHIVLGIGNFDDDMITHTHQMARYTHSKGARSTIKLMRKSLYHIYIHMHIQDARRQIWLLNEIWYTLICSCWTFSPDGIIINIPHNINIYYKYMVVLLIYNLFMVMHFH